MAPFCLQIIRYLFEKKLYLIFRRLQFKETFQLRRINAINIVSRTHVTFRKIFHLKEREGKTFHLVYFLVLLTNKMASSANHTH